MSPSWWSTTSPSMRIGDRRHDADEALRQVTDAAAASPRSRRARRPCRRARSGSRADDNGTQLFTALDPRPGRRAAPARRRRRHDHRRRGARHAAGRPARRFGAPLHVLLTGKPGEADRRLVVKDAPSFGHRRQGAAAHRPRRGSGAAGAGGQARLTLRNDGGQPTTRMVPVGRRRAASPSPIDHGGANVVRARGRARPARADARQQPRGAERSTACATGCGCCWSPASRMRASAPGATC